MSVVQETWVQALTCAVTFDNVIVWSNSDELTILDPSLLSWLRQDWKTIRLSNSCVVCIHVQSNYC